MYINLTINVPADTVAQLNSIAYQDSTKPEEGIEAMRNLMDAINGGLVAAEIELAVCDADPSVTASGGGNQWVYNKL